jgi:hypothetical protein
MLEDGLLETGAETEGKAQGWWDRHINQPHDPPNRFTSTRFRKQEADAVLNHVRFKAVFHSRYDHPARAQRSIARTLVWPEPPQPNRRLLLWRSRVRRSFSVFAICRTKPMLNFIEVLPQEHGVLLIELSRVRTLVCKERENDVD